ncbi:MAG TPA: DNA mismatch repair endonuclease MutL [Candidatus Omnitrophota bacterium]|nr:DNA mismatch repair endonuclease MutL [Candidatus Omnitrophota bacterium]
MAKVRILPPEIVSKIAAGEVIERPASVLKELLENSLDAAASSIEVMIKGAGKTVIGIKDNGNGIAKDDIDTLFNRHATSKISSIDDLYRIASLGFRGEALYSIAAVADITLQSKTATQDNGWEIHVRGAERLGIRPAAMHTGTAIEVKELFFNTPARKKFLKSNTAELNQILDIFLPYTLLFPGIRFSLTHESKKMIDLAAATDPLERVANALHLDKNDLIEGHKDFPHHNLSIRLLLGDINVQRGRKDMQFIFINNRPVQNRTLSFHVNEIYRMLLSPGVYPFFCVFITMPADQLDVNVHPTKREVKIKDELQLLGLLRPLCEYLLMTRSKARQADRGIFTIPASNEHAASDSTPAVETIREPGPAQQTMLSFGHTPPLYETGEIATRQRADLKEKLTRSRYLGNLLQKYLLFETDDSLLVIDQHAAQERIVFERLKNQLEKGAVEIQDLLAPILIKLTAQELLLWQEAQKTLEKMGFSTSLFDKETLALHSHPHLIDNPEISLRTLLAGENISRMAPETLARMACRSSVMAGFAMNKEQAEFQRSALLLCLDPFTCPHGRPTVVEIPETSLNKQFLRS